MASIWIDKEWDDVVQQSVILLGIRTFTGILKGCAHEIKSIANQNAPLKQILEQELEQPKHDRIPQYAEDCLRHFLDNKEILRQPTRMNSDILVEFKGTCLADSMHLKWRCKIQLTPQAVIFSFSNEGLLIARANDLKVQKGICKISTCMVVGQLSLSDSSIQSKMMYTYIDPREFLQVFSMHYELTLQEFKTFIWELSRLSLVMFEGGANYIAMHQSYVEAIDYSDEESESEEEQSEVFTHFKNYQETIARIKENDIIEGLRRAGLLPNFGLTENSYNSESMTSLTFHTPNSETLEEVGVKLADSDLKVMMDCLERFLNLLRSEQLTFKDLTKQKLFWDRTQIEQGQTGIKVFCNSFLHEILEVFGSGRQVDTLRQIQDFLLSKAVAALAIEGPEAEHQESAEELEDMAEVRISSELEERFYVAPIDGVSKAVIHYRDVSKLTVYEIKLLCDYFYRAYQINRHPCILTCYGYNYKVEKKSIYFAYEHCSTNLHSFITRGNRLPDPLQFLREVASGIGYLSSKPPMKVAISPKRILLNSKLSPKLMPFFFKESKDTNYSPPYDPVSPDWGKFLAYSFGLIAVFVLTGQDVEYQETGTLKDYQTRRMPILRGCEGVLNLQQLCFESERPDFKRILNMLETDKAGLLRPPALVGSDIKKSVRFKRPPDF
jgi:hypothetical protein